MAVRVKVEGVAKDLSVIVGEWLSPAAQRETIANFAAEEIAKGDEINRMVLGRVPPRTITVDGVPGARLEAVKPQGGLIVVEWELVTGVLQWIADKLIERSPVVSGDYRKGHTLFADGIEVPLGAEIPQADVYTFINLVPYVRKIEVGKTKSWRDFVLQVPNRIYERTAKDAKARFGNQAKISFGYETQLGAYRLKHDQAHRTWTGKGWSRRQKQSPDRVAGSAVTSPAIRVSLRDR